MKEKNNRKLWCTDLDTELRPKDGKVTRLGILLLTNSRLLTVGVSGSHVKVCENCVGTQQHLKGQKVASAQVMAIYTHITDLAAC